MTTYRLWQLFAHPPHAHPLFRRLAAPRATPRLHEQVLRMLGPVAPLAYLFGVVFVCCASASRSLSGFVIAGGLALVLFNGTLFGVSWGVAVAGELSQERERRTWELFCILPQGGLGIASTVAAGVMHRNNDFRRRYGRHLTILRVLLVVAVVLSAGALLDKRSVLHADLAVMYAYIMFAACASYADFVQSVLLGALTGIYAGGRRQSRLDAQAWALMLFLALQLGVYVFTLLAGFYLLPSLARAAGMSGWAAGVGLVALQLALFVGVRELAIGAMWKAAAAQLNSGSQLKGHAHAAL